MRALLSSLALLVVLAAVPVEAQTCPNPITFEGTQLADCFDKRLRGSELVAGPDNGNPCPGDLWSGGSMPYPCGTELPTFQALNIHEASIVTGTWLAQYKGVSEADGTYCVSGTDPIANGSQSWGTCARLTTSGATGSMVCGIVSEGKGTDLLSIYRVDLSGVSGNPWTATGATWTALKVLSLGGALLMYGGSTANARCCTPGACWVGGIYSGDNACHANRWWVKACLQVETIGGIDRYTATAGIHGTGTATGCGVDCGQVSHSHASPHNAIGSTYATTWTGTAGTPRPSGIATSGGIAAVMATSGGYANTSVTNFQPSATPDAPPVRTLVTVTGGLSFRGSMRFGL